MTVPLLGVNIDHVATLRNARGTDYPCPVIAATVCEQAGADGITLHLREDRRHIQDDDVYAIKQAIGVPMNLEMAVTDDMLAIACDVRPEWVCLVPEKREELTTEGGLDVINNARLSDFIKTLQIHGIKVSLFIDPDIAQIAKSIELGADAIELHTGAYAECCLITNGTATTNTAAVADEIERIKTAVSFALSQRSDLIVNAGHGLTTTNVAAIAQIDGISELNIGHAIIADSVFLGLPMAVRAMKNAFS